MIKKIVFIFHIFFFNSIAFCSIKESIINNLNNTQNFSFNFEQSINGKIESGNCTVKYPKKIYCKYNLSNKKILVSNGKSLVMSSYYRS